MRNTFSFAVSGTCSGSAIEETYLIDATAGALNRTLPDATLCRGARRTIIKKDASANAVTVNTTSAQTITGVGSAATSRSLAAQGNGITVESDGAGWWIVSAT